MVNDSSAGLTVREAAALSGCHPQTVRKAIRKGELAAQKTQGAHGAEWRIRREDLESWPLSAKREQQKGEPTLSQTHSRLVAIEARLRELTEGQKALLPSQEERQARAEAEQRRQEELGELGEAVGELTTLANAQTEEIGRLRQEMAQDRAQRKQSWWRRLFEGIRTQ